MLNIPEYKEYGGETKIALMDNSSLAFMHELSQRSYPSDGILSVYDLILIPKWVMEEIEDSTYRSTYVEQLQAKGYPIRWIDETKYGTFVNFEDVNLYYIVEAAVSRVSELMRFLRRKVKTEDLIDLPSAEEWMNRLYDEWPIHGRTLSTGRTLKKNAGEISLTILAEIFAWYHDGVDSLTIYTQDTDLRDPAIVIRKDSITFNTACITGLEDVVYVHVMFNNDLKRIVVRGCDENDKDALRWCVAKPDKRKSRKMSCKPFATLVYQKMGWDSECRYKMLGYRITFEGETLYVFDLLVPEIFHEGQRKKNAVDSQDNAASTKPVNSRKGFYLDDIVGTFGVPVEEHRKESEVKQMDGYVSMGILTGKIAPEAGKD